MTLRVLVVGGFGTIGGRLADTLVARGARVTLAGRRIPVDFDDSGEIAGIALDVTSEAPLPTLEEFDAVVHLAAMNDPACRKDPERARLVNVEGTRRVLDAAVVGGVTRFVYLSTAQVYGTPYVGHVTEGSPTAPSTVYAETHLRAEELVAARHDAGKLIGTRIRLANGFGVPSRPDNDIWHVVVNDLARGAVTTGAMTLRGSGTERRNFVSFGSICSGIAHVLEMADTGAGVFNLGSRTSTTTRTIAETIAARAESILGRRPELRVLGTDNGGDTDLDFDSSRLAATGFDLESDPTAEIDALLAYCAREFARVS